MLKKLLALPVLLLLAAALYLALTPSPIDPLPWEAPEAPPMTAVLEPNDTLMKAELLARGQIHGPEDTAVDAQGRVYAGLHDGRVVRVLADDSVETFADTGGRPLGMDFDAAGNLILADAYKGLLRIDPQGRIEVLTTAEDFLSVKDALAAGGFEAEAAEVAMVPQSYSTLEGDQAEKAMRLLENLEDLDDVQNVYTNADFV